MKLKRVLAAIAAGTLGIASFAAQPAYADVNHGDPATDDILSFGSLAVGGNSGNLPLNKPVVSMAFDPDGNGYWEVGSDGGVFAYNAPFLGSMGGKPLNSPIVGMASVNVGTDGGPGYYFVAADGGIFAYNAPFYGSMGGKHLNSPIVGMATTADGYYLVAADGGIFAYNVPFLGSMGGKPLNKPIVGMTTTNAGGYYFVASDGGIFAFGGTAAPFYGSTGGQKINSPIVGMATDTDDPEHDGGYYLVGADGGVFGYHAAFYGSAGGTNLGGGKKVTGIYTDSTGAGDAGYYMTIGRSTDNYCTLWAQTVDTEDNLFNSNNDPTPQQLNDYVALLNKVLKTSSDDAKPYWIAAINIWTDVAAGNDPSDADLQQLNDSIDAAHKSLLDRCGQSNVKLTIDGVSGASNAAAVEAATAK